MKLTIWILWGFCLSLLIGVSMKIWDDITVPSRVTMMIVIGLTTFAAIVSNKLDK